MTIESEVFLALKTLVANRVYPDPQTTPPARPYIMWQQVSGEAINYVDPTLPGLRNARIQINIWADTRLQVVTLMRQVEDAMRLSAPLQTTVIGAAASLFEDDPRLFGAMQDFSVWGV